MSDIELMTMVYDIIGNNTVTDKERAEVMARLDFIDYDTRTIVFDTCALQLQARE